MNILSLFDGMSVAQQALKDSKIDVEVYYASEIDEYAKAVTQSNFATTRQVGSVVDLKNETLAGISKGGIDLLIGGSPCQDLSIAKKGREGLKGSRSGLFWEYVRIRDEVKPKYFILENVASMPKEAKDTISEALGVEPVMINASLVSAQNRKRLFWVGKLNKRGGYDQVDIMLPEDRGILLKDILQTDVDKRFCISSTQKNATVSEDKSTPLTAAMGMGGGHVPMLSNKPERVGQIGRGGQGDRIYSQNGKSTALSANGGGRGAKTGLYAIKIPEATKKGYALATEGQSVDLSFPKLKTRRGRVGDKVKNIMTSQNIGVVQNMQIRKLTPTECLRLQSMPDNYFDKALYKGKPISNTQRYKMCGNAFNKEVIVHIIKHIFNEKK